jgi:hypothetical protein
MQTHRFLIAMALAVLPASAQTPCPTIAVSTKLNANCTAPLVVAANSVFLDLNGKTVTCPAGVFIGIDITNRRSVRVENGTVLDCVRGVNVEGGGKHTLKKLVLRQSAPPAGDLIRYGLWVLGSTQNLIEAVVAEQNSVGANLTIEANDNTIKGSRFHKNSKNGLQLDFDSTDNLVRDTTITENGEYGIYFGPRAARNVVMKTRVEKNAFAGLIPDSANVVEDSVIKGNGFTTNPAAFARGGIVLFGSNNIIYDNEVADNFNVGISTGFSLNNTDAIANSIRKNNAKGTKPSQGLPYDLADLAVGICTENFWKDNTGGTLFDNCEKKGGETADYRASGAGKVGPAAFQFNVRRKEAGAATGRVKVDKLAVGAALVNVEGRASCLLTRLNNDGTKDAVVGMIIEKSSHPAVAPLYQTLHLAVTDSPAYAADGSPLDSIGFGALNLLAPGDCPLGVIGQNGIDRGKILVSVKE